MNDCCEEVKNPGFHTDHPPPPTRFWILILATCTCLLLVTLYVYGCCLSSLLTVQSGFVLLHGSRSQSCSSISDLHLSSYLHCLCVFRINCMPFVFNRTYKLIWLYMDT